MEQETQQKHRALIFFTVFMVVIAGLFFIQSSRLEKEYTEELEKEQAYLAIIKESIDTLELEAKSVAIYNITQNKTLYTKNADEVRPLASLAKTMTAIIALASSQDEVVISKSALEQVGDTSLYLNQVWDKEDLVKLMLLASSNDAAKALAEQDPLFLEKMNIKARKLGMGHARFFNPTGLDETKDLAGAYGTARDANTLVAFALKSRPDLFNTTTQESAYFLSKNAPNHEVINTNTYLNKIPNIVFSKTGATNLAGGNLTVVFKNTMDEDIITTVLGSSLNGRFQDVEKIVKALYDIKYD